MNTYQFIFSIINYNSNEFELKELIKNKTIQWESIVQIGSSHLVLPAIYVGLKRKNLLELIPDDLVLFLEDIYIQNTKRNKIIMEEVNFIIEILTKEKINFCFIKGVALTLGAHYSEWGERMLGDIDILIEKNHIHLAQKLLLQNGYSSNKSPQNPIAKNHIHLPRLIPKNGIGAIELHHQLLDFKYQKLISSSQFLKNKPKDKNFLPQNIDLLKHLIFRQQTTDAKFNLGFSLKTSLDAHVILHNDSNVPKYTWKEHKIIRRFWFKSSLFLNEFRYPYSIKEKIKFKLYQLSFSYSIIRRLHIVLTKGFVIFNRFMNRMFLFISHKSYREFIIKEFTKKRDN